MKELYFILLIIVVLHLLGYSQGGVDVVYVGIDSLSEKYLENDVHLDFTSSKKRSRSPAFWRADTLSTMLGKDSVQIIEVRKRGVDYWYYREQYFLIKGYPEKGMLRVNRSRILQIHPDKILCRLYLVKNSSASKQSTDQPLRFEEVWFPKIILDGVMIQER
jgi:hypothetical protein